MTRPGHLHAVLRRVLDEHRWEGTRCACRRHSTGTHDEHVRAAVEAAVAAHS